MDGRLLQQIVSLTGLPPELVFGWLNKELFNRRLDPDHMTLEELKWLLTDLLQDLIIDES